MPRRSCKEAFRRGRYRARAASRGLACLAWTYRVLVPSILSSGTRGGSRRHSLYYAMFEKCRIESQLETIPPCVSTAAPPKRYMIHRKGGLFQRATSNVLCNAKYRFIGATCQQIRYMILAHARSLNSQSVNGQGQAALTHTTQLSTQCTMDLP